MTDEEAATPRQTRRRVRDVVSLLSIFAVVQLLLPSRYIVGPLGGAGAPAGLLGLVIGLWWLAEWLGQPVVKSRVKQPLKLMVLAFLAAVWASYLVAATRPLSPDEQLSADRSLISLLAWTGLMVAAMDGIGSRARLETLLRRVVLFAAIEACVGIVQSFTGETVVQYLKLPGLTDSGVDEVLMSRGNFIRPAGTATHPIEFGVTLSMLLPIALHFAVNDRGRRGFSARWLPVGAIALALPLSISRSAIICTTLALTILLTAWPARLRRRVYLGVVVLVAGLIAGMPGFFGTILGLFTGMSTDTSTASRTDSYALAWSFISRNPVFGRGTGTFMTRYRILDNQYLGSLIEIGVVGVICMLVVFVAGIVLALQLNRPPRADADRPSALGAALGACIAAGATSFTMFDALSFPQIPSMLLLALGCVGALRRLQREGDRDLPRGLARVDAVR